MRSQEQFAETWYELMQECSDKEAERADLEAELDEVRKQIAHLHEVLRHLAPLAGMTFEDITGLGITDAVRTVLEYASERMSPEDVRRALETKGFDFSGYSAPMSSIYKILGRLAEDKDSPVMREKDGRAVYYFWARPATKQAPTDPTQSDEITDDDIPF